MKAAPHMAILGVVLILSGVAVSGREIRASPSVRRALQKLSPVEPMCCDDLVHYGFRASDGGDSCAAVKIGSQCQTSMSWMESKEACDAIGARLCYFDEVESRALKGLGCDDDALTWTDERCIYDYEKGSNGYLAYLEDGSEQRCLSKSEGKAQLACCADPCSSTRRQLREVSSKSCDELKRDFPFEHIGGKWHVGATSRHVCATFSVGKVNGDWVCGDNEPWEAAQNKCDAIGARLCTGEELLQANDHGDDFQADMPSLGSGCDLNGAYMWSSESCVSDWMTGETGYLTAGAMGDFLVCMPKKSHAAKMACCADE